MTCGRSAWTGCVAVVALALPAAATAQQATNTLVESYRRASDVLRRGVEAHGGLTAIRDLAGIDYTYEGDSYGRLDGPDAAAALTADVPAHRVRVRLAADFARARWLTELALVQHDGFAQASRSIVDGRRLLGYQLPAGAQFRVDSLAAGAPFPFPFQATLMPLLVLRQAMQRESTLRYLASIDESGGAQHVITFTHPDGTMMTLRFDSATGYLAGMENAGSNAALGDLANVWRFSDYRRVGAFTLPHAFDHRFNGMLQERMRLVHIELSPPHDSLFQPPPGAEPAPSQNAVRRITADSVGDGAYVVEGLGAIRSMFVDTDDGVVVFEAPSNAATARQIIALIERTLPGRPIRYLVLTHHHADHTAGLAAYVARGATILVPPRTREFLQRILDAPRNFGAWLTPPPQPLPPARFEVVAERQTIGSGARAVDIINVGPTTHATGMLIGYLPAQRLLFQSDLLRLDEAERLVPGTPGPAELDATIRRHALAVDLIVAGRGPRANGALLRAATSGSSDRR